MIEFNRPLLIVLVLIMPGCASLSGSHDQYFVCSYDTVWDTALETLKGYSINAQNKDNGTIETSWIEMEGKERTYGIFGREGFGNRERARMSVKVKQLMMYRPSVSSRPDNGGMPVGASRNKL